MAALDRNVRAEIMRNTFPWPLPEIEGVRPTSRSRRSNTDRSGNLLMPAQRGSWANVALTCGPRHGVYPKMMGVNTRSVK